MNIRKIFEISVMPPLLIPHRPENKQLLIALRCTQYILNAPLFHKYDILHCIILTQVAQYPKIYITKLNMFFRQETLLLVTCAKSG